MYYRGGGVGAVQGVGWSCRGRNLTSADNPVAARGQKTKAECESVCDMSRLMTKQTEWHVCPAKTQISLDIRPSDQGLLCPHEESLGP